MTNSKVNPQILVELQITDRTKKTGVFSVFTPNIPSRVVDGEVVINYGVWNEYHLTGLVPNEDYVVVTK